MISFARSLFPPAARYDAWMQNDRNSRTKAGRIVTMVLGMFAIVALLIGVYVGGYLWLGEVVVFSAEIPPGVDRDYPCEWQMWMFRPATKVESWLTGRNVKAVYSRGWKPVKQPTS